MATKEEKGDQGRTTSRPLWVPPDDEEAAKYWREKDEAESELARLPGLIHKARRSNDLLTDEEHQQLLNLPELESPLLGKALAHPNSLTDEERREVLRWPADEIRRANVAKLTGASLSLEESLERASSDVGFLTFDRIMFVLNDYNFPPQDPDWNYEKTVERTDAQLLFMPQLEKKVLENAEDAADSAGLASQMEKSLAGDLNEEDAAEEKRKFAMHRKRYDELVWTQEVLKHDANYEETNNPKSEEDLYLRYFTKTFKKQTKDAVGKQEEFGFVFYRTAELRTIHGPAAEEFQTGDVGGFDSDFGFTLRLAIEHTLLEGDEKGAARIQQQGLQSLPYWPIQKFRVPFEFFFKEYLRLMLYSGRENIPPRIGENGVGPYEKDLYQLIRYQIADFEASETDLLPFRQHFRKLKETSKIDMGLDKRYFILCPSDVTPNLCRASRINTKRFVWVVDAEWEPPLGKDADDDDYQGRLKREFRRGLFTLLAFRLRKGGLELKEAWSEMKEHGWDPRY